MSAIPAVVLGSGPASWSLAVALTDRGTDVLLIAPDPEASWPQTYGMWTYQWPVAMARQSGIANPFSRRWDSVVVIGDRPHDVGRAYGVLANERVRLGFRAAAELSGHLNTLPGAALGVEVADDACVVKLADGKTVRARLVFDGTGANSKLVARETTAPSTVEQTAFGLKVRARSTPLSEDTCVLMDWRGPKRRSASFLYALPFGGGRWLFEETSLARRAGLELGELETRLRERLDDRGVVIDEEEGTESVSFPMDLPMPRVGQRVIPIGAAAALLHPATGYSVAASFRSALALADAVADSTALTAREATARCWAALWSTDRRKARRLESYGLDRLLTMDQSDTRQFFDTFFALDQKQTAAYLGGEAGVAELRRVMWSMFRKSPTRLQRRLATGNPIILARSLLG